MAKRDKLFGVFTYSEVGRRVCGFLEDIRNDPELSQLDTLTKFVTIHDALEADAKEFQSMQDTTGDE